MESEYTLFVVDDAIVGRRLIESAFGQIYTVESFESGPACLKRLAEKTPDLFMLDVDMPEMDGYTLCRQIKNRPDCGSIPVIFISALDDLESRVAGYDAGGNDYIVKPFKLAELKQKVEVLRRIGEERLALTSRLNESDVLTSLVLSNLDEYAILVKFLRSLNGCETYTDVANAVRAMLAAFNLDGALQFRLPDLELTLNHDGASCPLTASIFSHVRSMGTVAEFKNRAAFNFEHVSVLVNNMPQNDPELCGRLRDHLAVAVETLNTKLLAIHILQENNATKSEIAASQQLLGKTIATFNEKYEQARYRGTETTRQLLDDLDGAFASLGMREMQEEGIRLLIQSRVDELIDIFDFGTETKTALTELSSRLGNTQKAKTLD